MNDLTLESFKTLWQEADYLTSDLQSKRRFSTPELVEYLNTHLPPDAEKMTKTKVNYLRSQGIINPETTGEGEQRTSWRYTPDDVRRIVVVELLKTREDLSVQESKGWLRSFAESHQANLLTPREYEVVTPETPTAPTPVSLAYALLRNRTLGALINALGRGRTEITPQGCVIAIHTLDLGETSSQLQKMITWDEAHHILGADSWHMAASDSYLKLYIYHDLEQLRSNRPHLAQQLPSHRWYAATLRDKTNQQYQMILGLPEQDMRRLPVAAIDEALTHQIATELPFDLSDFPGLSTLLRCAFTEHSKIEEGPTLSVLAEIIANALESWDYCAILIPEYSGNSNNWLRVQEQGSSPAIRMRDLKGRKVEMEKFITGWSYRYRQNMIVEPTVENDPRIPFYDDDHLFAAAATPAFTEEQQVVGVVYVSRYRDEGHVLPISSKEAEASLRIFGYICGDIIARDRIEIGTVRSMTQLYTHGLMPNRVFTNVEELLREVLTIIQKSVSLENMPVSWIYLLTLNIQTTSQDAITKWLCQQGTEITGNFLANYLWKPLTMYPLPVGFCMVAPSLYVFAVLAAIDLPEEDYKQRIAYLQQEIGQMHVGRLSPDFYPSAITFRFEDLRNQFELHGPDQLLNDLNERVRGALIAGPYILRGHEALRASDLDRAVSEFEDALRYAPNSWYIYKHLAEARMLQGTEAAVALAIQTCTKAVELNPAYASARCLLAECLSYQGKFGEAMIEFERALQLNNTRLDFLTRYGRVLATMTIAEYHQALEHLRLDLPDIAQRRVYLDKPWEEAIDKFNQVRTLSAMFDKTPEEQQVQRADYYYHRGYAHLQAGLLTKAVEDFTVGRKLAPDNQQLAQTYAYAWKLLRTQRTIS